MNFTFKLSRRLAQALGAAGVIALAACAGDQPTDTISSEKPVMAVSITPSTASVVPSGTVQLSVALRDSAGATIMGREIRWSSSVEGVATVSGTGLVYGAAAGTATIKAESEGHADSAVITVTRVTPQQGYFVSPTGSSTADGSEAHPWSLAAALAGANGRIQPGDTVWLRAGTYTGVFLGTVAGAPGKPVVFRGYPDERATIDGRLKLTGPDEVVWGFEVMRSSQSGEDPNLEARGARQKLINMVVHESAQQGIRARQKLINMVVHESAQQGIRFWDEAVDAEMYGCIVYNNGTHENLDHGTYVHNTSGTKLIMDNVFFNNLAYGIHAYVSPNEGAQQNIHVIGNVSFNNGTISSVYPAKGNILIGGEEPGQGHQAIDNMLYFSGTSGENMRLGYLASNRDIVATGNTIWGGATALRVDNWSAAVIRNNTIGGSADVVDLADSPAGYTWSENKYYRSAAATAWRPQSGTAMRLADWKNATGLGASDSSIGDVPTQTKVFVRPNKYEPGRAMIVVYNWGQNADVQVDLSNVLRRGQGYEIRNVQDLFGAAVTRGTYDGAPVSVPMTGVNPPARIGRSTPTPPRTGPNFDTFIVIPK